MISGVGFGVSRGRTNGNRAQPTIVVPAANRFNGFTRLAGSSDIGHSVLNVAIWEKGPLIIRALYTAVSAVAHIAMKSVISPVKEAEAASKIRSLE